jgi:hypothetical protein
MRLMIAYDQSGSIVRVAKVQHLPEDIPHPFADLTEEHRVLSIEEPEEELREANLADIQEQFRVNTRTEKLVRQRR